MHKNTIIKISNFRLKSCLNVFHASKHGRFTLVFAPPAVQPQVETLGNVSNNDDSSERNTFLKKKLMLSHNSSLLFYGVQFAKCRSIFLMLSSNRLCLLSPFICLLSCRFAAMQRRQRRIVQKSVRVKPSRGKVFVLLI